MSATSPCVDTKLTQLYPGLPQEHRDHRPAPPGSLYGVSRHAVDRYMQEEGMDLNDQGLRDSVACEISGNRVDYRSNRVRWNPGDTQRLIAIDPEKMGSGKLYC